MSYFDRNKLKVNLTLVWFLKVIKDISITQPHHLSSKFSTTSLYLIWLQRYSKWKFWSSIWPWPDLSRLSKMWWVMHNDIISNSVQPQVCILNGCRDMSNWKISRSIWPWSNSSRSSRTCHVIHNDIISLSSQPQVCIFNGYWDMSNWKF